MGTTISEKWADSRLAGWLRFKRVLLSHWWTIKSRQRRERIITHPLAGPLIAFVVVGIGALLVSDYYCFSTVPPRDGWIPEVWGLLGDIFVIAVILGYVQMKIAKRLEIQNLRDEIDLYRNWNSDEAAIHILWLVKRLNRRKARYIDLTACRLSQSDASQVSETATNSFHDLDFTECYLANTDLSNSFLVSCRFNRAVLVNTSFDHSILNDCRFAEVISGSPHFWNAKLSRCYFTNITPDIILSETSEGCIFDACIFSGGTTLVFKRESIGSKNELITFRSCTCERITIKGEVDLLKIENTDMINCNLWEFTSDHIGILKGCRSLYKSRLRPDVEKVLKSARPELFEPWKDRSHDA